MGKAILEMWWPVIDAEVICAGLMCRLLGVRTLAKQRILQWLFHRCGWAMLLCGMSVGRGAFI